MFFIQFYLFLLVAILCFVFEVNCSFIVKSFTNRPTRVNLNKIYYGQHKDIRFRLSSIASSSEYSEKLDDKPSLSSNSPDAPSKKFDALKFYIKSLKVRPLMTKSLASMSGFMLGDIIVQLSSLKAPFDVIRCVRLGLFGALIHAPLGHTFYRLLNQYFPQNSKISIVYKVEHYMSFIV